MTRRDFLVGIVGGIAAAIALIIPAKLSESKASDDAAYVAALRKVLHVKP
jgi:hypothetical protein